jgi:voltage-gated potassium channel
MEQAAKQQQKALIKNARGRLLHTISGMTDKLMVGLALIWVGLMIADLLGKLSPALQILNNIIWLIFGLDFAVKFVVAPHKAVFLRSQWITILSLILPAFRLLRIVQAIGALRALSVLRILTSVNRNMSSLGRAMEKRGLGYVVIVTLIVLFGGAAGMYSFENPGQLRQEGFGAVAASGGGLHSYSDSVWWTAMLMTTIGSQYWPVTLAGRSLCFLLSLYSLGVFGYITAALASFFVGRTAEERRKSEPAEMVALKGLQTQIADLQRDIAQLSARLPAPGSQSLK